MTREYHETRFTFDPRRDVLWKTLCRSYFQGLIRPSDCVLELGAGYGHFINHIRCQRRIALDQWAGMQKYLAKGVEPVIAGASDLSAIADKSVDFVLASNLFEHLTQSELASTLAQLKSKLKPGGTLNILQPNFRLAPAEYFDDYTHVAIWSDRSLCDFLSANGFRVIECWPGFLPFSIKSRLPVWPPLIQLYMMLPIRPLAKQMWIRAVNEPVAAAAKIVKS